MHFRNLTFVVAVAVVLSLVQGQAIAQSVAAKPAKTDTKTWTPPRTVDGQPDLQGVWANNVVTPLERPKELAGRAVLTEQEMAALQQKAQEGLQTDSDAALRDPCRPRRPIPERALHYVRRATAGGGLQQLLPDRAVTRHGGHHDGDDSRRPRHSTRRPSASAVNRPVVAR